MTKYVRINTETNEVLQYPFLLSTLKQSFPNVSFSPEMGIEGLNQLGIYEVVEAENALGADIPFTPGDEVAYQSEEPSLIDGEWTISWHKRNATAEEKQVFIDDLANNIRTARNLKLIEADAESISHLEQGNPVPAELLEYKQALRDIPADSDFPKASMTWPTYTGNIIQHD